MAKRLVAMTCPRCGADINVPADQEKCFRTYCGTQILLDDGSYTVTHRTVDEARIAEVQASANLKREQLRFQQAMDWLWVIAMIVTCIITLISGLVISKTGSASAKMVMPLAMMAAMCLLAFKLKR